MSQESSASVLWGDELPLAHTPLLLSRYLRAPGSSPSNVPLRQQPVCPGQYPVLSDSELPGWPACSIPGKSIVDPEKAEQLPLEIAAPVSQKADECRGCWHIPSQSRSIAQGSGRAPLR